MQEKNRHESLDGTYLLWCILTTDSERRPQMADEGADEIRKPAAVYVSWVTFKNAMEQLAQGVPNQIDRSAFPTLSWAVQGQLLSGLRFLGLIDEKDKPTTLLHGLAVPDEGVRKKKLEAILRARYSSLFDLDLTKATPAQVEEHLGESYGVGGDTRGKAMRFFLLALEYLEIPVSRFLRKPGNGSSTGGPRRRRTLANRVKETASEAEPPTLARPAPGASRTVQLKSGGGTLSVSVSLDPFALSDEDQKFVFALINQLRDYEKQ